MSGQADALQFVDLNGNAIVVGQSFPDPGEERRIQLADALNRTPGSFALLPPDADYPYFICGRDDAAQPEYEYAAAGHSPCHRGY